MVRMTHPYRPANGTEGDYLHSWQPTPGFKGIPIWVCSWCRERRQQGEKPRPERCSARQEPTTPLGKAKALRELYRRFPDHPRSWVEEQLDDLIQDLEATNE